MSESKATNIHERVLELETLQRALINEFVELGKRQAEIQIELRGVGMELYELEYGASDGADTTELSK